MRYAGPAPPDMRIVPPQQPVSDAGPTPGGSDGAASEAPENVAPPADPPADPPPGATRPSLGAGTSHANLVGHVLADRYRLLKLIGEGGMGSVYQAEHITIGRKLAIKVLAPEYCDSPEVVARFLQEARTASMLHHEHIVDITDFGYTKQGLAFLTMEYLEGEDLATLLAREGPQPWARLRRIFLQVCRALNAAHEKGIVHRDMKPDNCFRIKRGGNPDFIKILDFGIAKVIADGQFGGREDRPKMATEAGTLLGTPEYMAPEIARDQKADARVDVYSLGILMYEMLTGSVPFKGQTFMATVAMQMVDEPEPPTSRAPQQNIPPELEDVILIALRKDPAERYQSVRELAEALIEADRALGTSTQNLPPLRFESGEYAAAPGESAMLRTSQLRPADAHASDSSMLRTGGGSGSGAYRPSRTPGSTGSHPTIPVRTPVTDPAILAPPPTQEPDEGSAMTRPNPYRALSVLLLLVVAGLGGAIWYLLQRVEPSVEAAPLGEPTPPVEPGPSPTPTIPVDPGKAVEPVADPEPVDPGKTEKPTKKRDPPVATVDATPEEKQAYINSLLADVSRCATTHKLARQQVNFMLEVDAGTGKVRANLESPQGNPEFASCAEKSIEKKRFKKGRKYMTVQAHLKL
jgi:serine/threonine protein kinase